MNETKSADLQIYTIKCVQKNSKNCSKPCFLQKNDLLLSDTFRQNEDGCSPQCIAL